MQRGESLAGTAVTEENKLTDIVERVAKVKGVQAIDNKVTILPANRSDDALRVAIANAIYRNPEFENYSMANPPIHVIVNNGYVTLTGIVRSEVEKITKEQFETGRAQAAAQPQPMPAMPPSTQP